MEENKLEENLNEPNVAIGTQTGNGAAHVSGQKEPEAIIQRATRYFRVSNLIYILGGLQVGIGILLGVVIFFLNAAGYRGYGNYYYNMPRFSGFFGALFAAVMVFLALLTSGVVTIGFGKMVQAAEIYIHRRTKKQQ